MALVCAEWEIGATVDQNEQAASGSGLCLPVSVESGLGVCMCGRQIGVQGVTNDGIKLCFSSHLTGEEQGNILISGFLTLMLVF